jgi:hypothetical protein
MTDIDPPDCPHCWEGDSVSADFRLEFKGSAKLLLKTTLDCQECDYSNTFEGKMI